MEGKLSKNDSKYLKTALRLLRQSETMFLNISKKSEIDEVSAVTAQAYDNIGATLEMLDILEEYIATGKYIQLSLEFEKE